MTDKKHIFISYSGESGKRLARRVSGLLDALGFDADLPVKPIWEPDRDWDDAVVAAIRTAQAFVFIEPSEEQLAPHVLFEVGAAHALGKRILGVGAERNEADIEDPTAAAGVLHIYDLIDASDLDDAGLSSALAVALAPAG